MVLTETNFGPFGRMFEFGDTILLCPLSSPLSAVICSRTIFDTGFGLIYSAGERAAPRDVGDQTVMRVLGTAFPFKRPGLSLS